MSGSHFLSLEDQIHDRLRASLDTALMPHVRIYSAPSLPDGTLPTPSIIVMYDGYHIAEIIAAQGRYARITQTWLAFVTVRSAANIKSGEASRSLAGEMADVVLTALMGWTPAGCSKPLILTTAPKASYEDGFFYLPIAVEAELIRKST